MGATDEQGGTVTKKFRKSMSKDKQWLQGDLLWHLLFAHNLKKIKSKQYELEHVLAN